MELRPATQDEFEAFSRAVLSAFHREPTEADRERYGRIDEPQRSLACFEDGRIVATTGAFTRELTVPGGLVPSAAVTTVAVLPPHRRRGLLTAMMRRQLEDLRERWTWRIWAPRTSAGTTLSSLAGAGRVRELTPGAVARASVAFRGPIEPWCPEVF